MNLKTIVAQLIEFGVVNRGFIGISPFDVTDSIREQINLPVAEGVIIAGIVPGYPADIAGLKVEDVIVKLDEFDISNSGDLSKYLIKVFIPFFIAIFPIFSGVIPRTLW